MANETKNQEFNRSIKQLQAMIQDKQLITLAEKFYNLKMEMSSLTRSIKEKENALVLAEAKSISAKSESKVEVKSEEKPSEVFVESKVEAEVKNSQPTQQKQQTNQQKPRNIDSKNGNFDRNQRFNQQNQNNRFQNQGNYQNRNPQNGKPFNPNNRLGQNNRPNANGQRPFNPNFKAGQKPMQSKDGMNKRPSINYAQPVITASPTRTFANKKKENERFEEKRAYSKRDLLKRGMLDTGDEDRVINRKVKTKKKDVEVQEVVRPQGPAIITTDNITVKLLSEVSGKPVSEIIKKFMILGMMVTINSTIDFATAELVLSDMGIELVQKLDKTSEEKLQDLQKDMRSYSEEEAVERAPIVTVMGHVDHGKTSLLDYIRKSKVTLSEAGGITQAIGAYRVNVGDKNITFIDTPGHEAFTAMRARGASLTDIAILIVAADDGIMPQTVEAINHIKSANIPMIVAINKIDKPQAEPDKIMTQLAEHNVLPEAWGGDAIICKISAKTGEGIDKLLETILLVADVQGLKANPNIPAMGTIMEARLDKGRGPIASVVVRDGSLKVGDTIVSGTALCKVKAMIDENNKQVKIATPSMPVTRT